MAGLDDLIKAISDLDSGWKIAGFVICALLILVTLLNRKSGRISNPIAVLIIIVMLIIGLAPIIAPLSPHPAPPATSYKITITVNDSSGKVYNSEEANVFVNNVDAIPVYSAAARAWEFTIAMDAFPKDRGMIISAESRIRKANLQKTVQLTDDSHQTFVLFFPVPHIAPPPPKSFSINLEDPSIRQEIEARTGYTYNPVSPTYKIVVGYDPNSIVYRPSSDTYVFRQSCPVVLINGESVPLKECIIPESYPTHQQQTTSEYGRLQAIQLATDFLKTHPTTLAQWIKR